jgi:hypothetical protein
MRLQEGKGLSWGLNTPEQAAGLWFDQRGLVGSSGGGGASCAFEGYIALKLGCREAMRSRSACSSLSHSPGTPVCPQMCLPLLIVACCSSMPPGVGTARASSLHGLSSQPPSRVGCVWVQSTAQRTNKPATSLVCKVRQGWMGWPGRLMCRLACALAGRAVAPCWQGKLACLPAILLPVCGHVPILAAAIFSGLSACPFATTSSKLIPL